jgi:Signal transduction histidine kinase
MKILHLEDNPHDAELTNLVFAEEWPDCQISVVSNRSDFLSALHGAPPDLILSDFNLASFNGLEALQLAREQHPEIPFIFLSGTIGEDRAVEALRSGASDYVIKDRPKRLVPAVRRALDEARLRRERKAAEEQLLRVQRLENIGMLASGIAHDFNNVLAPVLMAVPLLRDRLADEADQRILNTVEKSVERGAGLVRQILGFAHGVTGEAHLIQPKHVLRDLLGVMQQTFPRGIRIEDHLEPDLWPLKVNPTQLHQIFLNLCVNARDAMPQGGTLRLSAANLLLDEFNASSLTGAKPGPYLRVEISDTGTGIAPDALQRIWEPFFTTKEAGRGTGLGLSTVRSIVENYQGVITLHSRLGQGTTFQVYLPATPGTRLAADSTENTAAPRGQGELILVVDDDDSVRDLTTAMLSRHGYRVLAAASGTEAVALFAPRSLEVRLIVTDIGMPELDGYALAKVATSLNPSIHILAISGLVEARDRVQRQHVNARFLAKPFTSSALLASVHDLLHSGASTRV